MAVDRKIYTIILGVLLVLSITAIYISIATENIPRYHFYNSDALTIPAIYKDLSSRYNLLGWEFAPAPSFFPDMPLYIIINFLAGNVHLAIMIYGVVQFLLFLFCVVYLSNKIFGSQTILHSLILLAAIVFCVLLSTGQYDAFLPILLSASHFGATLSLVFSLLFVVQILEWSQSPTKAIIYSGLLLIFSTLTLTSDTIYLVQFLIPVMGSILLLFLVSMLSIRQMFYVYIALTPSIPVAARLSQFLLIFREPRHHHRATFTEIIERISEASQDILHWAEGPWFSQASFPILQILWMAFVVISLGLLIVSIKKTIKNRERTLKTSSFLLGASLFSFSLFITLVSSFTRNNEFIWVVFVPVGIGLFVLSIKKFAKNTNTINQDARFLFIVSFFVLSVITNITSVLFIRGNLPRYFIPTLLFPLFFGWPFLFGRCKKLLTIIDNHYILSGLVGGTLLLLFWFGAVPDVKEIFLLSQLSDYYPDFVRCLDANTKERNIHKGMTQYWDAKYISLLSKNNLHLVSVRQVNQGLFFEHFMNNLNWYHDDFEFVITEEVHGNSRSIWESIVIEAFGEPADTLSCRDRNSLERKILVYNRKNDTKFQKQFQRYFSFDFYAADLPSETGQVTGLSRMAAEESDKKGFLTFGPYIELIPGDYVFEIHYEAKKNREGKGVGKWDVIIHSSDNEIEVIGKGSIDQEGHNIISEVVKIREKGKTEIRTYYTGRGSLKVDKITIRRIR